jgi:S1-C subfamily serine protease
MQLILILWIISSFSHVALSLDDQWDEVRFKNLAPGPIKISMGSGFYINPNNIVTNYHVVRQCKNIAVRGATEPHLVTLQLFNETKDLAILYSDHTPAKLPYLRVNYNQVKVGDILFSVGYPLERGRSGIYIIQEAQVTKVKPEHTFVNFEFTDSVDHGNSGGPLLDNSSNIVGVVTSKVYYRSTLDQSEKVYGSAISVEGLIELLNQNNIPFYTNNTYDIFINYNPDELTKNYVVNIHCMH